MVEAASAVSTARRLGDVTVIGNPPSVKDGAPIRLCNTWSHKSASYILNERQVVTLGNPGALMVNPVVHQVPTSIFGLDAVNSQGPGNGARQTEAELP